MNRRLAAAFSALPAKVMCSSLPSVIPVSHQLASKTTVSRPLAKAMEPAIKQVHDMENNACHGGMRSPHRAKCVTSDKALALGKLLRQSILKAIRKDTSLLEQAVDMLQGKPCSMTPHLPKGLRADLAKILRVKPPADKGISPDSSRVFATCQGTPTKFWQSGE